MSLTKRLLLISILTSFAFWIPIWLPFAASKGLTYTDAFQIIGVYTFLVVLFEYPTGVLGDTVSHKLSTLLGYILTSLGYFLMIILSGQLGLYTGIIAIALGTSFISGSDQSYFYSILPDYKKFYPTSKNISLIATLIGISSGSVLYQISTVLPLWLSIGSFIIAFILLLSLPKENRTQNLSAKANPFLIAKDGIISSVRERKIRILLLIFALLFAFSNNMKWLYGNIFEVTHISTAIWGILIALFYFGRLIGIQFSGKFVHKKHSTTILLVALANLVFAMGFIVNQLLIIFVVFVVMIIIGIVETDIELAIQEHAPQRIKASILSLKSLLGRLAASVYILGASYFSSTESMYQVTTITFAMFLFGIGLHIYNVAKEKESVHQPSGKEQ